MSAIGWGFKEFTTAFFDTDRVKNAVEKSRAQALTRFGAYARAAIRNSIKKAPMVDARTGQRVRRRKGADLRPATAPPGSPPYSHEGSLRNLIFFAYDPGSQSVVVGPAKFKNGGAPRLLEFGGAGVVAHKGRPSRAGFWRGNPFVRPAAGRAAAKFSSELRGMVN